jgi:hypothetical protein
VCCRSVQQLQQAVGSIRQQQEQLQQHPWEELQQVRGWTLGGAGSSNSRGSRSSSRCRM